MPLYRINLEVRLDDQIFPDEVRFLTDSKNTQQAINHFSEVLLGVKALRGDVGILYDLRRAHLKITGATQLQLAGPTFVSSEDLRKAKKSKK